MVQPMGLISRVIVLATYAIELGIEPDSGWVAMQWDMAHVVDLADGDARNVETTNGERDGKSRIDNKGIPVGQRVQQGVCWYRGLYVFRRQAKC